jgi:hypothetical protein
MSHLTPDQLDEMDRELDREERPARAELALQLYEVNVKLRPDREPPISYVEWARLSSERMRLQMALGWKPNEGRR